MTHNIDPAGRDYWVCEVCQTRYYDPALASVCEQTPVRYTKGITIGTKVKLFYSGRYNTGTVYKTEVLNRDWSPPYYHTLALYVTLDDSFGGKFLTYKDYEIVNPYTIQDTPVIQIERAIKV